MRWRKCANIDKDNVQVTQVVRSISFKRKDDEFPLYILNKRKRSSTSDKRDAVKPNVATISSTTEDKTQSTLVTVSHSAVESPPHIHNIYEKKGEEKHHTKQNGAITDQRITDVSVSDNNLMNDDDIYRTPIHQEKNIVTGSSESIELPSQYTSTVQLVVPSTSQQTPSLDGSGIQRTWSRLDEDVPGGVWKSHVQFFLVMVSTAVGLGNIWRLPTVAHEVGPGPFLVAYLVSMLLLGVPLVFLEMALGQFCSYGVTKIWKAVPLLQGVGVAQILIGGMMGIYYMGTMSYSLLYIVKTVQEPLPWNNCNNSVVQTCACAAEVYPNCTVNLNKTQAEICFEKLVLHSTSGADGFNLLLIVYLLAASILIYLCIFKGSDSLGRAVFITAPVVLLLLFSMLGIALTDKEAKDGLTKLIDINMKDFLHLEVWHAAIIQMFFSLTVGVGNLTAFASRLELKNNILRDAIIFTTVNIAVALLSMSVAFLWLEMVKHHLEDKAQATLTLQQPLLWLYIVYYLVPATAIEKFQQLWAFLAFLALFSAGLNSMVALSHTVATAVTDEFLPNRRYWCRVAAATCLVFLLLATLCIHPYGMQVLYLLDHYTVGGLMLACTLLELVGFMWIYGVKKLSTDLAFMLGFPIGLGWKVFWVLVIPVVLLVVDVLAIFLLPLDGSADCSDPVWVMALGWSLYFFAVVIIVLFAARKVTMQFDYGIISKLKQASRPERDWGPQDPIEQHNLLKWRTEGLQYGRRVQSRSGMGQSTNVSVNTRAPKQGGPRNRNSSYTLERI